MITAPAATAIPIIAPVDNPDDLGELTVVLALPIVFVLAALLPVAVGVADVEEMPPVMYAAACGE